MFDDLLVSFQFELLYKGERIPFQEISGLSMEAHTEEVGSGGENRFKYRLPTVTTYQNLVLKHAIVPLTSNIALWCQNSIGGGLNKKMEVAEISVNLLNSYKIVTMKWTFHKAYPVKYSFSDLKSQDSALLIESMELAYTYFEVS